MILGPLPLYILAILIVLLFFLLFLRFFSAAVSYSTPTVFVGSHETTCDRNE